MADISSKKVTHFLRTESDALNTLFAKIKAIELINFRVNSLLDPSMRQLCKVGNIHGNKLVLIAANSSVATNLRFLTSDLIVKFKQEPSLRAIADIQIKVRPSFVPASVNATIPTVHNMQPLSPVTAEIVKRMAESLSDPALRKVMERIASRIKSNAKG